ncbi:hypothetical protein NKJ73_29610 [Mesorhizobium sp. M0074]|uniref:hypothetical protein n=1 Tax=Mesorhizobium sp. M0074 TaxID=2956869 RepID=UPI00333896EA
MTAFRRSATSMLTRGMTGLGQRREFRQRRRISAKGRTCAFAVTDEARKDRKAGAIRGWFASLSLSPNSKQWIVTHHEERHSPPVRKVGDRIAALMRAHQPLFRGETPIR